MQVFIVTASIKWAVEPGAEALGLSKDQVIGIETLVDHGLVTAKQHGFISYRDGKVQAWLGKSVKKLPFG